MSSLGEITTFLGHQVRQSSDGILLHQGKCVEDMLVKFVMQDFKVVMIPIVERPMLNSDLEGKTVNQALFRSMINSLMYMTT